MSNKEIRAVFDDVWDENDEKSTEWLISMTADRCGVDYGRVVSALEATSK